MEWHSAIKIALASAKGHLERGDLPAAAAAYDKAAHFMTLHAEEAVTREIEASRKRQAVEYRKLAVQLRGGDATGISGPGPVDGAVAATGAAAGGTGVGPRSAGGAATSGPPGSAGGAGANFRRNPNPAGPPGRAGSGRHDEGGPGSGEAESEIAGAVKRLIATAHVGWDDIGGMDDTKAEIKFALALSVAAPPEGVAVAAFRNILLYGPPGTGKTLLAAATSNAFRTADSPGAVFYNVKVSSVMSKYFGESTKLVSELYGQARDTSPAVVFLDEFEALAVNRDADNTGPERRILSTILSELDGLSEKGRRDIYVLTVAATNRPWDMDPAVLSRFEKQIYIPLPEAAARAAMLRIMLDRRGHTVRGPSQRLVELTEGLSGREIERLCKEVVSRMVAELNADLPKKVDEGMDAVRKYRVRVRPLEVSEFETARTRIVPVTGAAEVARYEDWRAGLER